MLSSHSADFISSSGHAWQDRIRCFNAPGVFTVSSSGNSTAQETRINGLGEKQKTEVWKTWPLQGGWKNWLHLFYKKGGAKEQEEAKQAKIPPSFYKVIIGKMFPNNKKQQNWQLNFQWKKKQQQNKAFHLTPRDNRVLEQVIQGDCNIG